ncbi:DUF2946 domain-containing protein [Phenylobacterium sp.]|jgi:hypothetical protein|uniref:DUF2946 domain-containing protein n=1 Tax=Phenylobacterium sp. TaxID=1871053 RepID=UPI002F3F883D
MNGQISARNERRAIVALFAVFALLVQSLIPAAAMAGPRLVAGDLICEGGRVHADGTGVPANHKALGMPCQDCLAAAVVAIAPPIPELEPAAYAPAHVEHAAFIALLAPRARAPPRPFGQGPPTA